jgi:hypothetical protein
MCDRPVLHTSKLRERLKTATFRSYESSHRYWTVLCAEERAAGTKRDLDGHGSRLEQYSERRLEQYFDETVARTYAVLRQDLGATLCVRLPRPCQRDVITEGLAGSVTTSPSPRHISPPRRFKLSAVIPKVT